MAWLKLDSILPRHRKVRLLASALNLPNSQIIGMLVSLWTDILEQQEDGILERWSHEMIAHSALYSGDPDTLVKTLINIGWLDTKPLRIHDWLDYAGNYIFLRYHTKNPDKISEIAEKHNYSITTTSFRKRFNSTPIPTKKGIPRGIPTGMPTGMPVGIATEKRGEEKRKSEEPLPKSVDDIKIKHGEFVRLKEGEYEKLRLLYATGADGKVDKWGDDRLEYAIKELNNKIGANGYEYKSHFHVLKGWMLKQVLEDEKAKKVRFTGPVRPVSQVLGVAVDNCRDCGLEIPISEWDKHICPARAPESPEDLAIRSAGEAVRLLSGKNRPP